MSTQQEAYQALSEAFTQGHTIVIFKVKNTLLFNKAIHSLEDLQGSFNDSIKGRVIHAV